MLTAVQKEQIEYIYGIAGEVQDSIRHDSIPQEEVDVKMGDILSTCSKLLDGRPMED